MSYETTCRENHYAAPRVRASHAWMSFGPPTSWCAYLLTVLVVVNCFAETSSDPIRNLQTDAIKAGRATWGYWGTPSGGYYDWCQHSNRLVPVYTFGMDLSSYKGTKSVYRDAAGLEKLYRRVPEGTLNPAAEYLDQTDLFRLQLEALAAGKTNIILVVFDGLDWHTTRAAALYRSGGTAYEHGRGTGLRLQDYRGVSTDFGYCVTSPDNEVTEFDVNTQRLTNSPPSSGCYDPLLAGMYPWDTPRDPGYLFGWNEQRYHPPTDSANSATALVTGVKSYNGAINVDVRGQQAQTIAHIAQTRHQMAIGVVTNVPISHATPAAAYAHNVSRLDYQDLARDLLGLKSISHPREPLPGVDVLLGGGWGEMADADDGQGENYVPGNIYLADKDRNHVDAKNGGKYIVAERTAGRAGHQVLREAVEQAAANSRRLLGIFGVKTGHLPYRTADNDYRPTDGVSPAEVYSAADRTENPTLAELTRAALTVLSQNPHGFWLMVEAGDVDWASHDVNIDNTIGAILSGDEAFDAITTWAEENHAWRDTVVIVTSDHGHGFTLTDPAVLRRTTRATSRR